MCCAPVTHRKCSQSGVRKREGELWVAGLVYIASHLVRAMQRRMIDRDREWTRDKGKRIYYTYLHQAPASFWGVFCGIPQTKHGKTQWKFIIMFHFQREACGRAKRLPLRVLWIPGRWLDNSAFHKRAKRTHPAHHIMVRLTLCFAHPPRVNTTFASRNRISYYYDYDYFREGIATTIRLCSIWFVSI